MSQDIDRRGCLANTVRRGKQRDEVLIFADGTDEILTLAGRLEESVWFFDQPSRYFSRRATCDLVLILHRANNSTN